MTAILRYVLITALRDKLFIGLAVLLAVTLAVSAFMGEAAIVEKYITAAVYAGAVSRTVIVFGMLVFICFHVQRLYESKEIEAMLSRPVSREAFVVSYWTAFTAVAFILCIMVILSVSLFLPVFSGKNISGFVLWGGSLVLESMIIVALGLFCSLTIRRAVNSILIGTGFYMLTRLGSLFVSIAEYNTSYKDCSAFDLVIKYLIETIVMVMPRLDLFGQTRWFVYGGDISWSLLLVQTAVYVPLLVTATIFDMKKKQF